MVIGANSVSVEDVRFTPESGHVRAARDVRFGPKADIGLFDHFIRKRDQPRWNGNAECFGSLKIDHELKFGRLENG